ncbi:MAG: sensor domain-containing diguanylate cyclase [Gammaproteobacteria bacterium]|nr:sensor domain-containing diguanylate cyclase [Gammaproteobacteria bacterium]
MAAQPKQTKLQLNELETLKHRLEAVYDDARNNEKVLKKFQYLELKLLSCSSLSELIQIITHHSRSTFGWDTLTIILHDEDRKIYKLLKESGENPDKQEALQLLPDITHVKHIYGMTRKPTLGKFDLDKHRSLFLDNQKYPRSVALLPLQRNNCLLGSLNLGSYKLERFQKGSATDFLQHLAAVLATCLHTAIAHERLKQAGLTDSLTGINNRRFFDQRLEEEISRNKRLESSLGCLFIDIDHFKIINDSYGHDVGDTVLKKVAELVRAQTRSIDVVARYGGEEFAILLGQSGKVRAIEIAERIRSIIADTKFKNTDNNINITVSVGVSTIDFQQRHNEDPKLIGRHLLQRADKALYQAKQSGRDQVVFLED